MVTAAIVGIVAMLQVTQLAGVADFLYAHYDAPFEGPTGPIVDRGTSTIASSFGVADVMIMNLVIAIALLHGTRRGRWLLAAAIPLFLAGCIVAGSFSGFIGLIVAILAIGFVTGRLGQLLLAGLPVGLLACIAFWPVVAGRLSGFERASGLPHSWEGRWANLEHFFLPELAKGLQWVTGVRPAARVPAPEAWREFVYIESGYVWLLWIGGLPFLLAFLFFVASSAVRLWRVTCRRGDAVAAAAATSLVFLVVIVTLMLFDPHLTVRGSADLFFPLLALAFTGGAAAAAVEPRRRAAGPFPAYPAASAPAYGT
jgi:hypothetical protein